MNLFIQPTTPAQLGRFDSSRARCESELIVTPITVLQVWLVVHSNDFDVSRSVKITPGALARTGALCDREKDNLNREDCPIRIRNIAYFSRQDYLFTVETYAQ